MENDFYVELIQTYTDDLIDIVKIISNNLIDLGDRRLQIHFLLARFSVKVVYGALDNIGDVDKNEFIPTLIKLCQERLREINGI